MLRKKIYFSLIFFRFILRDILDTERKSIIPAVPVDGNFRNGVKLSEVEVNFKLVHLSNLATFCHDFEFHLELATIFCMESVEV